MATLRTDYVNDILAAAMDGKRQYQMINNPNGTVSFVDVTQYDQNGDTFSAGDVNGIDTQINENTSNIATNTSDISTNTSNIQTNASNIASLNTHLFTNPDAYWKPKQINFYPQYTLAQNVANHWGVDIDRTGIYKIVGTTSEYSEEFGRWGYFFCGSSPSDQNSTLVIIQKQTVTLSDYKYALHIFQYAGSTHYAVDIPAV